MRGVPGTKKERNIIISLVVGLCKKGERHLGRCVRLICIYLPSAHCSTINTINRPGYTTPSNGENTTLNVCWYYVNSLHRPLNYLTTVILDTICLILCLLMMYIDWNFPICLQRGCFFQHLVGLQMMRLLLYEED